MITHEKAKIIFRKKGLPKKFKGVDGLSAQGDIEILEGHPKAKTLIFKNKTAMRRFYDKVLPEYRGVQGFQTDKLGPSCLGFVNKITLIRVKIRPDGNDLVRHEVDRKYFCIICLVEGHLTAEILCHEAVHVGFAWDFRTQGGGVFANPGMDEENVCHPAGRFLEQVIHFIKNEGLKEI